MDIATIVTNLNDTIEEAGYSVDVDETPTHFEITGMLSNDLKISVFDMLESFGIDYAYSNDTLSIVKR